MQPRIATLPEKNLAGLRLRMSFSDNRTGELWRTFMPRLKEITNFIGSELYSVEVYDPGYFDNFNPAAEFEKWAAVEVTDFNSVPDGMEMLAIPVGLYAVFVHKGLASEGIKTYRYIFETWLRGSGYLLDDRPHFAVMGEKYKNEDPASEEEIWIPVRAR